MSDDETNFDKFWQASSLDKFNVQEFARALNVYDSDNKNLFLEYPEAPVALPNPKSAVNKLAKNRQSQRSFSGKPLTEKELGLIFSSFYAANGLEHRSYPSAGATYTTEIFGVVFSADKFTKKIIYYDPEKHGVVIINDAQSWEEASKSLNMNIEGTPGMMVIFVAFPERATSKYGERGGRFMLLEAGAAMQQLSLQIADSKLKGVTVGGMLDEVWKQHLKLTHTDAKIVLGYIIGK